MKALQGFVFTLIAATAVFGQTPAARPEFEVASVKASAPVTEGQFAVGVHIDGAMVRCSYLTLRNYLTMAYDVKDYQIVAPDSVSYTHLDVYKRQT